MVVPLDVYNTEREMANLVHRVCSSLFLLNDENEAPPARLVVKLAKSRKKNTRPPATNLAD